MKKVLIALLAMCATALADHAQAQEYPSRPVRMLVGYAAGGGADGLARILAQRLGTELGQQFVVDNRPGAGGTIAAEALAKAPPDGYTLYFADTAILIAPVVQPKLGFDPARAFTPVGSVCSLPLVIVANLQAPAQTAQDDHRLRDRQSRQALLRLARHRDGAAPRDGAVQVPRRRGHRARPVQGRVTDPA